MCFRRNREGLRREESTRLALGRRLDGPVEARLSLDAPVEARLSMERPGHLTGARYLVRPQHIRGNRARHALPPDREVRRDDGGPVSPWARETCHRSPWTDNSFPRNLPSSGPGDKKWREGSLGSPRAANCPSWARTRTLLIQSQTCCQLHQGAMKWSGGGSNP